MPNPKAVQAPHDPTTSLQDDALQQPPQQPSQLTVVQSLYHTSGEFGPTELPPSRFARQLQSSDQPYVRHVTVGEEWTPIDAGWVKDCGMLCVFNREGESLAAIPTQEQAKQIALRVVELAFAADDPECFWLIRPGESFRGEPSGTRSLVVRCRKGSAKVTIAALPA